MENRKLDKNYLKTLTVLYAEDDEDSRNEISRFLRLFVGRLITTVNGAEGVEAFSTHSPDIVLTDILMPVMDGLAMAREIRKTAPKVPIMLLTGFEETDYMMSAINIGITRYIVKPVSSYLLLHGLIECAGCLREELQTNRLLAIRHG